MSDAYQTLRATAALGGYELYRSDDGYLIGRWGLLRPLDSLHAVVDFLRRATGREVAVDGLAAGEAP
jgi:hypothetical protein